MMLDGRSLYFPEMLARHRMIWCSCEGLSLNIEIAATLYDITDNWPKKYALHNLNIIKKCLTKGGRWKSKREGRGMGEDNTGEEGRRGREERDRRE